MITIHTPVRANGYRHNISFTNAHDAQAWVDRQIDGGDDGDWTVSSSYVYDSLDEHDLDRFGPPKKTGQFVATGRRLPLSQQVALLREYEKEKGNE